ncbi:MAG: response regulator [bacterium]
MSVKILVVDDEDDVRESTAMVLQSLGYGAATCGQAADILDAIDREHPDIILQDLKMPGLNVSGLVASLRSNPATADIPLVFFSANEDLSTTAARYDVWGYISKPFEPAELQHLLLQILGASPHKTPPPSDRDLQRDLRQTFHDYWNILSALGNYIAVLKAAPGLIPDAQHAVRGLDDLLLKLETKTDRLRSYLLSLAGQTSTVGTTEPADQRDRSGGRRGPAVAA